MAPKAHKTLWGDRVGSEDRHDDYHGRTSSSCHELPVLADANCAWMLFGRFMSRWRGVVGQLSRIITVWHND